MMNSRRFFTQIIAAQAAGIPKGIPALCTANSLVLQAAAARAARTGRPLLIEATCNQINQYGGYTKMRPTDFRTLVLRIAEAARLSAERVVLGGDHLGPNPWRREPASEAMTKAAVMIREYIRAGFSKIHLDASMPLGGDPVHGEGLPPEIAAARSAELCRHAEDEARICGVEPVYVIGTEVPPPGGSKDAETGVRVTDPAQLEETVSLSQEMFAAQGLSDAWQRVVAVVVQPGVEFAGETVHDYRREENRALIAAGRRMCGLVFEGHSTDYQTPRALRQMVEDGIAILKVGPGLTFALREAVFALAAMEEELLGRRAPDRLSHFVEVLDRAMLNAPQDWQAYYTGDDPAKALARKYSFFDRSRYYWTQPEVQAALRLLLRNLAENPPPPGLLSQYLPVQYRRIRAGMLTNEPYSLILDRVDEVLADYDEATSAE